jgi:hypothetical protein
LLLETCSTFDKKRELPCKQKRAVYAATITDNDPVYPYDLVDDDACEAYRVDTDISEIMAYESKSNCFGNQPGAGKPTSTRIP